MFVQGDAAEVVPLGFNALLPLVGCVTWSIYCVRLFNELQDTGRPFSASVVRLVRSAAKVFRIGGALVAVAGVALGQSAFVGIVFLLVSSVLEMASGVLEYGCVLQLQDDQTL